MDMMELTRTATVAFYNKEDAQEYILETMDKPGIVGVNLSIEETDMKDRRTSTTLTVYTVATFYDLTEIKTVQ